VPLQLAPAGPQLNRAQPYAGPPASIDGPEELAPGEEPFPTDQAPAITIDDAPLFDDLLEGTLLAPRQKNQSL
jgi:hypothetical protein